MKKVIVFSILALSFQSCLLAQTKIKKKKATENFIKTCITNMANNYNISNSIVLKSHLKNSKLEELFTPDYFYLINKYNVKSEKDIVRFNTLFSKEEFLSMQNQIKNNSLKKWSQLIGKRYFKKDIKRKYVSFSIPVFNKDYTMAIAYLTFNHSVELRVFKKTDDGSWKHIAGTLLSSSN